MTGALQFRYNCGKIVCYHSNNMGGKAQFLKGGAAMRKRLAMLLVCAGMLSLLAVPTAAAKSVYFTAVNENILELKEETMPFWSGQNLYVDSAIFSDRWLGLYCNRNRVNGTVVILETSGQRRALVFELDTGYVTGSDGNNYYPAAVQRNGQVFVPAGVVADYFGLTYNNIRVDHGFLIWIHSANATVSLLTAQEFANAASYQMTARYQKYLQSREAGEEENGGDAEDPAAAVTGKTLNLCFRMGTEEHARELLGVLRQNGANATFYLTAQEIRTAPDTVRHIAVAGHRIGILLTGTGAAPAELREANEALFLACGGKTRLCAAEKGVEGKAESLRQAGYCLLIPKVDGSVRGLYTGSAESLFQTAQNSRGSVTVWLGESVSAEGLQRFLTLASDARDRILGMTERDG